MRSGARHLSCTFGPWDFESGWQGWTDVDLTTNATSLWSRTLLSAIPGSRGNAFSLSGNVCLWCGDLGQTACAARACFPGYDNNTRQVAFKTFAGVNLNSRWRTAIAPTRSSATTGRI